MLDDHISHILADSTSHPVVVGVAPGAQTRPAAHLHTPSSSRKSLLHWRDFPKEHPTHLYCNTPHRLWSQVYDKPRHIVLPSSKEGSSQRYLRPPVRPSFAYAVEQQNPMFTSMEFLLTKFLPKALTFRRQNYVLPGH